MIKFALPNKGQLFEPTLNLLKEAGYKVNKGSGSLSYFDSLNEIEFFFLRPNDIPMYLSRGSIDVGITGTDYYSEKSGNGNKILDLPFGSSKLCAAVPKESNCESLEDLINLRVATSFPNLVKKYFKKDINISQLSGAVEISVKLGIADAIVDIVETGSTIKKAGLKIIGEPLFYSNAALFSNQSNNDHKLVNTLKKRLEGILLAKKYVMIEFDTPNSILEESCKIIPSIQSPTITQLFDSEWYSVKSMVPKNESQLIVDRLENIGCKGIILMNILSARL